MLNIYGGELIVPSARMAIKQQSAFSIVDPSTWTNLPSELCSIPQGLFSSFYKLLINSIDRLLAWLIDDR